MCGVETDGAVEETNEGLDGPGGDRFVLLRVGHSPPRSESDRGVSLHYRRSGSSVEFPSDGGVTRVRSPDLPFPCSRRVSTHP